MEKRKKLIGKFCKLAEKFGAREAKVISAESVFTAPWVRQKCRFGCGGYGQTLTCPPYSPTPEETRRILDSYNTAILVHCSDGWDDLNEIVVQLEREIFLGGYYKAFGLSAGPCNLCDKCNLKQCQYPDKARPSMEACGIDVFQTARSNGFKIKVLKDTTCKANYFGLVLIE